MTREELQAQQGKLLPDRIELRRAKRRRCRGAQEYTMRCDAWVYECGYENVPRCGCLALI